MLILMTEAEMRIKVLDLCLIQPRAGLGLMEMDQEVTSVQLSKVLASLVKEAKIKSLMRIEDGPLTSAYFEEERLQAELDNAEDPETENTYWFYHMDTP